MIANQSPILRDLVLVGGGHSHVTVLKRFGMRPLPGVRLTLICRDVHTPYSGMLPGLVAGHYEFDEAHIDLGPLSRFAGARFYHDEVLGIDLAAKRLFCRDRPPVAYDLVSINTGSTPAMRRVPGARDHAVPVKPIEGFFRRWKALETEVRAATRPLAIGVVGGGAGGVELLLAMQFALRGCDPPPTFHLFSGSEQLLPTHADGARTRFEQVLRERSVRVHAGVRVARVEDGSVELEGGERHDLDEVLWVTDAGAPDWLGRAGLDVDEGGFVRVKDTLESTSHEGVFAAGDVASVVDHPREKAGVFAVRQGPPLERNLRRVLTGKQALPFRPQTDFLSLISTGNKYAVGSRGGRAFAGKWVWRLKDWIDRRFMKKFNELPEMEPERGPEPATGVAGPEALEALRAAAMRCGGCGAKVGATVLSRVMSRMQPVERDDVLIGLDAPDDAAAVEVPPGKALVMSVDHFRAIVDDPYLFGKIGANHALGDVFAMGAEPQTALAIVTVPFGVESKVEELLDQLLRGALEVFAECHTALVGGHTGEGPELALGFAVNGLVDMARVLQKGGMAPGDALLLTKPLGTGTLFAADMRLQAKGRWITAALATMLLSNRAGAEVLHAHGATACTDVTGFGLLGHLAEMTRASKTGAELELDAVPALDGALECLGRGITSSLAPENLRLRRAISNLDEAARAAAYPLLFDPQTSGGLLASVPTSRTEACLAALREAGYERAVRVGTVTDGDGSIAIRC